jgi:hypothetical protein
MKIGRRSFLGVAAGAAALKLAERASEAAVARATTAGRFALELEGGVAGWLQSVKGGDARADVVAQDLGGAYLKKHLAQISYADIEMSVGMPTGSLADWIEATLGGSLDQRDGAIIAADYQYKEQSRREFESALITEVSFPALDGASKDAAYMTVKLQPEYTNRAKGSGAALGAKTTTAKKWLCSNFRLTLGDLDCSRVTKIDSLTIKRQMQDDDVGGARGYARVPGNLEVSDLVVTLPEAYAQDFADWHEDFVVKGNCSDGDELKGKIELLAPNLVDVLGTIELWNVGIFGITDGTSSPGVDSIRTIKAEMYVERVSFETKG